MCFSATASCIAGAALVAVGARTLQLSRGRAEVPLGLVPMLFGVEQLTEGVGAYFLYFLVRFPVGVHVFGDSLVYDSTHTYLEPVLVVYVLVTCACGLASSHHAIRAFGVLAFVLAALAYLVKAQAFVSVWCLFAAILSLVLYAYFAGPDRDEWATMADEIEHTDRVLRL